ncbi:hypothetical protein [Vibrio maritimus]|uniref:hypothetical protein n=1 Tax=Vibrio maritimus TaxID=990268 RepID=UPI001F18BA8C|nr:hypothetical protein [Vibrio maritimus]
MKHILIILMTCLFISACSDDGRTYIGENNYYVMAPSEVGENTGTFEYQNKMFPKYFISRAKEWPREDLSDASSYDLPRIQFYWANMGDENDPMYNDYEGSDKIWSMKTDGTDLRLVTDEFPIKFATGTGKMVRSPNMRYLAYGYSGTGKAVYDLKTGKTYDLESTGGYGFLWGEDSSYLYYKTRDREGLVTYKWNVKTNKSEKVDVYISDTGVIRNGKRYVVSEFASSVYDESTGVEIQSVLWGDGLPIDRARGEKLSLSPEGKFAWGNNIYGNLFFVDIAENRIENSPYPMPYLVGLDAVYGLGLQHVNVMKVRNHDKKTVWQWRPLAGNRTITPATLYNVYANNGRWFEESENDL